MFRFIHSSIIYDPGVYYILLSRTMIIYIVSTLRLIPQGLSEVVGKQGNITSWENRRQNNLNANLQQPRLYFRATSIDRSKSVPSIIENIS